MGGNESKPTRTLMLLKPDALLIRSRSKDESLKGKDPGEKEDKMHDIHCASMWGS